jgi:hypothetical protein
MELAGRPDGGARVVLHLMTRRLERADDGIAVKKKFTLLNTLRSTIHCIGEVAERELAGFSLNN